MPWLARLRSYGTQPAKPVHGDSIATDKHMRAILEQFDTSTRPTTPTLRSSKKAMNTMDNLRVLVLDDDKFMLDAIRAMLKNMGGDDIKIGIVASPALSELNMGNQKQFLLCGPDIPDMNGVEAIRHFGQNGDPIQGYFVAASMQIRQAIDGSHQWKAMCSSWQTKMPANYQLSHAKAV